MPKKRDAKSIKPKMGRPSKYLEEYNEQAYKLALLGATDKQLADFFDISEALLNNWKLDFPNFVESLKRGKLEADAQVAQSLFKRAIGYRTKEEVFEKIVMSANDDSNIEQEAYRKKVIKKDVAADTTAAIFWLKNRQAKQWRDKPLEIMQEEMRSLEGLMTGYATAIEKYKQAKEKK